VGAGAYYLKYRNSYLSRRSASELQRGSRSRPSLSGNNSIFVILLGVCGGGSFRGRDLVHDRGGRTGGNDLLDPLFLWIWGSEYVFFCPRTDLRYIYYYTWDKISPRSHIIVGWIYAISAYMSLVMINGILAFMLTPGGWLQTGTCGMHGFNPSFLPSTLIRTVSALALAGIFSAIVVSFRKNKYSRRRSGEHRCVGIEVSDSTGAHASFGALVFLDPADQRAELALGGTVGHDIHLHLRGDYLLPDCVYAVFGMLRKPREVNLRSGTAHACDRVHCDGLNGVCPRRHP